MLLYVVLLYIMFGVFLPVIEFFPPIYLPFILYIIYITLLLNVRYPIILIFIER